uniref:Acidic leucine-rich nuclear phosphoprotein 32 family member A n=1 Tax=Caligus clemensi TaxID=344056 RepID=C1C1F8_CALCM|nr:Acidic leucine-rich nuclear phosphoprotein 32 family member A [Caligus clemensi]
MKKRIELERRGKDPSEISELNLDNSRATQIEGLTDEYTSLSSLSLISVGLTTLKGFPSLPKLLKLELSENRITSGLNALTGCPGITHLNLSNNRIKDLESLDPLKSFSNMTHLDLFNNDVCKIQDYRTKVFALIPSLKFLDGYDVEENEAEESDSESYEGGAPNGANSASKDEEDLEDEDISDEEEDELGEGEEEDLEEEEEDELEDEEEEEGPGLASIYNTNFNDVEDGDYQCNEDGEEPEDDEPEDLEDEEAPKEKRRKLKDQEDDGGGK